MPDDAFRNARLRLYNQALALPTVAKVGAAVGMAGVTALLAQVSSPLPWTPVPLTLGLFGILLSGVLLGPRYGLLSMLIYIGAGALGLHVFASSADSFNNPTLYDSQRWRILVPDAAAGTGYTAGYIAAFPLAAWFVGSYLRCRAAGLPSNHVRYALLLSSVFAVIAVGASFFVGAGHSFVEAEPGSNYRGGMDYAWLFAAAFVVVAPVAGWLLSRRRDGLGKEALGLYLVLFGAMAIIHTLGVIVLKFTLGMTWTAAVTLGSAVFLPFDALKAALTVALVPAFLPTPGDSP